MSDMGPDQAIKLIKQLSVFLPNRLGALLRVTQVLEANQVHVCALSTLDAADHAVVRMVVDRPAVAKQALIAEGYSVFETELLAVRLPLKRGAAVTKVLSSLLLAEVNIHYIYSLMILVDLQSILALHVEDFRLAGRVLRDQGLELVGQEDIAWTGGA